MSDQLTEALVWFDDLGRVTPWHGSHLTEVLAAARNWHTLTSDPRVQKRRWHQPITVQPKDRPDLADDLPAGEYLIVPVDALTDTAEEDV